jgi:hypothetical protein
MGLRPIQGDEKRIVSSHHFLCATTLPFVIPSEVEGSAVQRRFPGNAVNRRQNELSSRPERTRISCHVHQKRPRVRLSIKKAA